MKFLPGLIIALTLLLSGCNFKEQESQRTNSKEQDRLARLAEAQRKVDTLMLQAHACDKNGGIVDIDDGYCYRGRCRRKIVKCADGMQRDFLE